MHFWSYSLFPAHSQHLSCSPWHSPLKSHSCPVILLSVCVFVSICVAQMSLCVGLSSWTWETNPVFFRKETDFPSAPLAAGSSLAGNGSLYPIRAGMLTGAVVCFWVMGVSPVSPLPWLFQFLCTPSSVILPWPWFRDSTINVPFGDGHSTVT